MDPMGCGPVEGSVNTVTEYTGSVNRLCTYHVTLSHLLCQSDIEKYLQVAHNTAGP